MRPVEEFSVKNAAGKTAVLQLEGPGSSYLDYGSSGLPRTFQGYRIKDTSGTAEKLSDGTFKLSTSGEVFKRA